MTPWQEPTDAEPSAAAVGRALLVARLRRGLTQQRLAEAVVRAAAAEGEHLGLSGSAVSRWEHGTFLPALRYRRFLAEVLGLDLTDLIPPERSHPLLTERSSPCP